MDMLKIVAVPMHNEGRKFVAIAAVITAVFWFIWQPLFWVGVILTIWVYYFFRDPVRSVPQQDGLIVSPADGVVSLIVNTPAPAELGLGDDMRVRVSVFMNVFNCHVNRTPVGGKITKIAYHHGKFVNASLDKASEHNERNGLAFELPSGHSIGVVQIAGLVARRILCLVEEGQTLETGERFGLIRFGSRLDIYLPPGVNPLVTVGQTAVAGETILADLAAPTPARSGKDI